MNPTNDPLIEITPDELACILRYREARQVTRASYFPKTHPEIGRLTLSGRLWYVVEFILQEKAASRAKDSALAESWRDRAQAIATKLVAQLAAEQDVNADSLREIANALDGKHLPQIPRSNQQRVLSKVNEWCAENPGLALPTHSQLKAMGLRGELVSDVIADLQEQGFIRFPKGKKPGRRPKK